MGLFRKTPWRYSTSGSLEAGGRIPGLGSVSGGALQIQLKNGVQLYNVLLGGGRASMGPNFPKSFTVSGSSYSDPSIGSHVYTPPWITGFHPVRLLNCFAASANIDAAMTDVFGVSGTVLFFLRSGFWGGLQKFLEYAVTPGVRSDLLHSAVNCQAVLVFAGREHALPALSIAKGEYFVTEVTTPTDTFLSAGWSDPSDPAPLRLQSAPGDSQRLPIPGDVLFAFDSDRLSPKSESVLAEVAKLINGRNFKRVLIIGHTDSTGGDAYNLGLSKRRAQAVKDWMVRHHVANAHGFLADGKGEREPEASNATPGGRSRNRRVEFRFTP